MRVKLKKNLVNEKKTLKKWIELVKQIVTPCFVLFCSKKKKNHNSVNMWKLLFVFCQLFSFVIFVLDRQIDPYVKRYVNEEKKVKCYIILLD